MSSLAVERKRKRVQEYCGATPCNRCVLEDARGDWCPHNFISTCEEEALDEAIELIDGETDKVTLKEDVVNHPSHYTNGGMECIDEMILIFGKAAVMNFCLCNVWKYRKRALHKNGQEDLDKADWYMNKYKELKEEVKDYPFSFLKEGVTYGAK